MDSFLVITVAIMALAMMMVLTIFAARYKKVPPDSAFVIYGRAMRPGTKVGFKVITSGGKFILPIIEAYERLDLQPQKIELDFRDVKVVDGGVDRIAKVSAHAVVRLSDEQEDLTMAAQHLLHVNYRDVGRMARNLFEAHLRSVLRSNPFEEAKDRIRAGIMVKNLLGMDLIKLGVAVDELVIHEIKLRGGTMEVV